MKKSALLIILITAVTGILTISCRTDFEKIRTSNDAAIILENANAYFDKKEYSKAQALYELAIPAYRGQIEAEDIYYNYAYTHYYTKQYILSSHYFKNFANTFVNSLRREEAEYMSAYSNYLLSPSYKLDQSYSEKAIDGFQLFINTYPRSERVEECNILIDEIRDKLELKAYEAGKLYYDLKHYNSAIQTFDNMLKDFPETVKAEYVKYLIVRSSFILAQNSVYIKREERYLDAVEHCNSFLKKYPESEYSKEVNLYKINSQLEIKKINT